MTDRKAMLPLAEAAQILRTTPLNILMHIKRGLLQGAECDGAWLVESASVEALLAKTGGGKADAVCTRDCPKQHACGAGCGA